MEPIKVRYGEVRAIQKLMGVSQPTVLNALKGKTKSDLAQTIRDLALNRAQLVKPQKEILTRRGEVGKISMSMGRSITAVTNALKGRTRTDLALQIRALALQRGGVEVEFK